MSTLSDQTYEILKKRLIDAEAGVFLSVRKCAAELNMSYTPVREALIRLQSEGLLESIPNVGFFVVRLDIGSIISIYQSRDCVEHYALPIVVPKLQADDVKYLRGLVIEQQQALKNMEIAAYAEIDIKFHLHLITKMNNKYLTDFYRNIREQYLFCSKNIAKNQSGLAIEEHSEFLDLVEEQKFDEAMQKMIDHTTNALERIKGGYIHVGKSR